MKVELSRFRVKAGKSERVSGQHERVCCRECLWRRCCGNRPVQMDGNQRWEARHVTLPSHSCVGEESRRLEAHSGSRNSTQGLKRWG